MGFGKCSSALSIALQLSRRELLLEKWPVIKYNLNEIVVVNVSVKHAA